MLTATVYTVWLSEDCTGLKPCLLGMCESVRYNVGRPRLGICTLTVENTHFLREIFKLEIKSSVHIKHTIGKFLTY